MAVIPFYIRRAPVFRIFPYLIHNNFNLEKFSEDCLKGKVISTWNLTPVIKEVIDKRYSDAKKIGYFKTTKSSSLYLKKTLNIDFLTAAKIDEYDLDKYDVLIFEGEIQDDNIYKKPDIQYTFDGKNVRFKDTRLDCYYTGIFDNVTDEKQYALKRWCFTGAYMMKNKKYKLDYYFDYQDDGIEKTRTYFYTKLN